jgi:hypothetical protein
VVRLNGPVLKLPDTAREPLQPPLAVQLEASWVDHVNVDDPFTATCSGSA